MKWQITLWCFKGSGKVTVEDSQHASGRASSSKADQNFLQCPPLTLWIVVLKTCVCLTTLKDRGSSLLLPLAQWQVTRITLKITVYRDAIPQQKPCAIGVASLLHSQPLCQPLNCLIWTTASAHSCSEKLEEGEGDQFCSGYLSLPKLLGAAPPWVTAGACWLYCRQASSTRFSFRFDSTTTTHTFSSIHLTDLVSLLQPPHIIFPLRPRGGALSSFLWSFCSDIAGTGQTRHHTRIFYQQSLFCLVSAEESPRQLCWALSPPSRGLGMSSCFQP